ncbi:MAG: endonuclease VII domain-containing protein, partial [Terracidiphilus sp.]
LGQLRRRNANPEQTKQWYLSRRAREYGVTPEWITETTSLQKGLCGICGQPPTKKGLAVDHCHKTGQVRGLLCSHCNTALHKMESDPVWFDTAMKYLQENR